MYRITELQEWISKNLCVYTLQCLDGKPDEMRKAVVDVNQDNHFRLLKYIFLFFFFESMSLNYIYNTEFY